MVEVVKEAGSDDRRSRKDERGGRACSCSKTTSEGRVGPWFETEARRWPRNTMAATRTPAGEGAAWGGGEEGGAAREDKQGAVEELQEAVSAMASLQQERQRLWVRKKTGKKE